MKGDFSRNSFDEKKHYSEVLLQQGRVQIDSDWNEAEAIEANRDERTLQDVIGPSGSPNNGFRISARQPLDEMESLEGWSAVGTGADLCIDYVDYLRGTASLRAASATEVDKVFAAPIDLSGADDVLVFAVKSAKVPPPIAHTDNGFTIFAADNASTPKKASWTAATLTPQTVGVWQVYTCPLTTAAKDAGLKLKNIQTIGFSGLKPDWVYHFDLLQRDFAPVKAPLQDVLALDMLEDLNGWSVPAPGTGSVSLDGSTLFQGSPTVKITGPGDGLKSFGGIRDLRVYGRVIAVTNKPTGPGFFLKTSGGTKIKLTGITHSTSAGWTTHIGDIPADPNLNQIVGYGFEAIASGSDLNIAQVLVVLNLSGNFFILGGEPGDPGRLYVDGIACQKEAFETYFNQHAYPEALAITPADTRIDLVYLDVWQRHITTIEDPEIREVALGGPDTTTRLQTTAQVKVLSGAADASSNRLDCAKIPQVLKDKFAKLTATGLGTLSTLVAAPTIADNLCEIAPDTDYLGLDNRLYRVEIQEPGPVGTAKFKWSRNNGAIAVAVVADVVPGSTPQTVRVERLGRDKATTLAVNDWVEIADDLTDLADNAYGADGLPLRRLGELRQVKAVDPDTNTITVTSPLSSIYTVTRHAKVRKWDGAGYSSAAFVDLATTPQLDFGDGVHITFDGTQPMQSGDYWQFTARGITGQVEKLDHALPAGVAHHFAPLALIKWKANGSGGFDIADIADCRNHFPALTAIQATDVAYDDGCCGLSQDVQTLAAAHGDVVEGKVDNVQQAIDVLCDRESEYLELRYVSGDGQEGLPGAVLPAALIVAVDNVLGEPQNGVTINFQVLQGGGSVAGAPAVTGANGEAKVTWALGSIPGLNLIQASLNTPQGGQKEIIYNARGVIPDSGGGLCTFTVGDGVVSHGQFNGFGGLLEALKEAQAQGGGTICLLRGNLCLQDNIVVQGAQNIVIEGNRLETILVSAQLLPIHFINCHGIELHDLQIVMQNVANNNPLEGLVRFTDCTGVMVDNCLISAQANNTDMTDVVCLLVESTKALGTGLSTNVKVGFTVDLPLLTPPAFIPPGFNACKDRLTVLSTASILVRNSTFATLGTGRLGGITLRNVQAAYITNNLVQVFADGGGLGIDLDANSDICLVLRNTIVGFNADKTKNTHGALGGIHVGSGCDLITLAENQIFRGAGFGIGLGSIDPKSLSLGGLASLTIYRNHIRGMAMSGIGIPSFTTDPAVPAPVVPVTNDLLVAGNHIEGCAFDLVSPISLGNATAKTVVRLAAGVALWSGNQISLFDNEILENGHSGDLNAPHPVAGMAVFFPDDSLAISRNTIKNNFSNNTKDPDGATAASGGIFIQRSSASVPERLAMDVTENNVAATNGPVLFCGGSGGGALHVSANHFLGVLDNTLLTLTAERGSVMFENNYVVSELTIDKIAMAVLILGFRTSLHGNQFLCLKTPPVQAHVLVKSSSIDATGNHALETVVNEKIPSLWLTGDKGRLVAVANVTTNGVKLDPDDPTANLANLKGVMP